MILRIWAYLTGGKVVWLMDHDGEITRTIARPIGFGKLKAMRMAGVYAILDKNGKAIRPSYVAYWEYANKEARR